MKHCSLKAIDLLINQVNTSVYKMITAHIKKTLIVNLLTMLPKFSLGPHTVYVLSFHLRAPLKTSGNLWFSDVFQGV